MADLAERSTGQRDLAHFEGGARVVALCLVGFFVAVSVLVHFHLLFGLDLAVAEAKGRYTSDAMRSWSEIVAVLVSAELSVVYAAVAIVILLRKGFRAWAFAPAGFLVGLPVEVLMKSFLHQSSLPAQFRLPSRYPLTIVNLPGSFPSGHAMRTAFFLVFLAVLFWNRGDLPGRAFAVALLVLMLPAAYTRIYMGYHWTSDVLAGLALGAAIALLLAPPLLRRLRTARP